VQVREAEQKPLADQALADFAAREGIALPAAPMAQAAEQPESARKSMGPAAARE
jgi:hypothetical protein